MSVGDPGPYINDDGAVWVPRAVPYREAWKVARDAVTEWGDGLRYDGKVEATLFGFTEDCWCEDYCRRMLDEDGDDSIDDDTCRVPAWKFQIIELARKP